MESNFLIKFLDYIKNSENKKYYPVFISIASEKSKSAFFIDDECIEKILDVKCFNGKSFMEIERFIEVTKIF